MKRHGVITGFNNNARPFSNYWKISVSNISYPPVLSSMIFDVCSTTVCDREALFSCWCCGLLLAARAYNTRRVPAGGRDFSLQRSSGQAWRRTAWRRWCASGWATWPPSLPASP